MLLPVALDASDASVVGSSLRLGVSPPDATASGACFFFFSIVADCIVSLAFFFRV